MKRAIKNLLCFFAMLSIAVCFSFAASANENITVTLDGKILAFDQNPVIEEGRTLVPLRGIFEEMGASVYWDGDARCVTAIKDDIEIKLTIGEKIIYKNGIAIPLDVPAQIVNSRTLVPARSVSESFGARVSWNENNKNVIISTDSVLNSALSKLDDAKEIEAFAKGKILYNAFECDMTVQAGVDFDNKKAFVICNFKSEFGNAYTEIVFNDGKAYVSDGNEEKIQEGIVCDFNSIKTPVFVLKSETETEKTYSAKVYLGSEVCELEIVADKNTESFVKASVLKDTIKRLIDKDFVDVLQDFELKSGKTQ